MELSIRNNSMKLFCDFVQERFETNKKLIDSLFISSQSCCRSEERNVIHKNRRIEKKFVTDRQESRENFMQLKTSIRSRKICSMPGTFYQIR